MVATRTKPATRNTSAPAPATPATQNEEQVINQEQTTQTNGTATTPTNGDAVPTTLEEGKLYQLKEYRAITDFNMSAYLRGLVQADPAVTTEDVIAKLGEDHPQLTFKKEAIGQVLSNVKTALKGGGSGKGSKSNDNVTMEDVVKAKGIVKEHGGIEVLLSSLEAYRKFKVIADAFGGEEKAVKVLELMDALRKE